MFLIKTLRHYGLIYLEIEPNDLGTKATILMPIGLSS
jgi:hypothetical protein